MDVVSDALDDCVIGQFNDGSNVNLDGDDDMVEDYPCQWVNDQLTMCLDEKGGDWRRCKEALEELRKCHLAINKSKK